METLTPADVQAALKRLGVKVEIQFYDTTTATSEQAADRIGCDLGQIVKSLAFLINGDPIVVLTAGDQRVDDRKLAMLFDVGRKRVKMATAEQCVCTYGYPPGGVPPVGYRTPELPVYLDLSLQRFDYVYPAAGAHNAIFGIELAQLARITGGEFVDVVRD